MRAREFIIEADRPTPKWLVDVWANFRKSYRGAIDSKSAGFVSDFFIKRHNVLEKGKYLDYAKYGRKGKALGTGFRVLQILGYGQMVMDFLANVAFYEDSKKSPENPYGLDDKQIRFLINHDLGILIAQIAASKTLAYVIRTAWVLKWLITIIGAGEAIATGGLALPLIIASEAFQMALMAYLNTPEGRKHLAELLVWETLGGLDIAELVGRTATSAYDTLRNIINRAMELAARYQQRDNPNPPSKPEVSRSDAGQNPSSNSGQGTQNNNRNRPGSDKSGSEEQKPGQKYSDFTDDPELKKALQDAGL